MRFAELDAVTIDAYGTLVTLTDPTTALARLLAEHGIERAETEVAVAFAAEAAYYRPHSVEGRDEQSLARLRRECAGVFLEALGSDLSPENFASAFVGALRFEPAPRAAQALAGLRARGLELAVVANWDCSLRGQLVALGLERFLSAVVTSAETGVAKPDPAIFRVALERIRVSPERALHIGDEPGDESGAAAAGMRFAPAPLTDACGSWT